MYRAGSQGDETGKPPLSVAVLVRAYAQSRDAILITNQTNRILTANPAFSEQTGYSLQDVVGRDLWLLLATTASVEYYTTIWPALLNKGQWKGVIRNRHKDGSVHKKWLTISSVTSTTAGQTFFVANITDISAKKSVSLLAQIAWRDALTGLPNRVAFLDQLAEAVWQADLQRRQFALLIVDVDHFTKINSTFEHRFGDLLLRAVAQRLRTCIAEHDFLARVGSDEFAIVSPYIKDHTAVMHLVQKIESAMAPCYELNRETVYATASIGISIYPNDGIDDATLLRKAETAVHHAKHKGRGHCQFYAETMNEGALKQLQLETTLRQAVMGIRPKCSEFFLQFQPLIHAHTGQVCGLQAQLYWRKSGLGSACPSNILSLAEAAGAGQQLSEWMIGEVCRQASTLRDYGVRGIRTAFSVTAQQLRRGDLPLLIESAINNYELRPEDIEIQVPESFFLDEPAWIVSTLHQLAEKGIHLTVSHFGTGYTSLASIKQDSVRRVMLDDSFVKDIETHDKAAALCAAIIALAHSLNLEVVAVGVNTETQQALLKQAGCDFLQGALYSKPVNLQQLLAQIRVRNGMDT